MTTTYEYDAAGRLVREGNRQYKYGYFDKVLSVTEGEKTYSYDYHADGQLASADYGDGRTEDFAWDGLALIRRGDAQFINEPHVGGGNPVVSSTGTSYFNDMLGTTVGTNSLWESYNQNCAKTIADALKAGGAQVAWYDWWSWWNVVWTPNDVKYYADAIQSYYIRITEVRE